VLVNGAPQQVWFTTQGDEHLVEVPRATRLAACRFHTMGKARAKLLAPSANGLVADRYSALEQQLFDVAQAELEPKVPTHSMADDRCRKPVAVTKRFRFCHRVTLREHLANVTVPLASRMPRWSV
jgi:hypothetical protein